MITYLRGNDAVRQGRWLYIRYRDGGEELYDRSKDPHELRNLAGQDHLREVRQELRQLLPDRSSAPAPLKSDYAFNPVTYTWAPKR